MGSDGRSIDVAHLADVSFISAGLGGLGRVLPCWPGVRSGHFLLCASYFVRISFATVASLFMTMFF